MSISLSTPTTEQEWAFIEALFLESFPADERPPFERIRELSKQSPYFKMNLVRSESESVGFISIWNFDTFTYGEHAAFHPSVRGKGLGSAMFIALLEQLKRPMLLEVEPPTDEMAIRRIGFYQRLGFELSDRYYVQPPYGADRNPIALRLMTHNDDLTDDNTFAIRIETLYQNVYRTSSRQLKTDYPELFRNDK